MNTAAAETWRRNSGAISRRPRRWAALLVAAVLRVGPAAGSVPADSGATRPPPAPAAGRPSVLVLYPDDRMLPANRLFDESFQSTLGADSSFSVECVSEFLDERRFPASHQERMRGLLQQKFAAAPPQAIVAFAQPSLEFCRRYRAELFPEVPVVFALLGNAPQLDAELGPRVTGVRSSVDAPATLRLALQLHPRTRHVFVVGSPEAKDDLSSLVIPQRTLDAQLHHLPNDPVRPLLDELTRLPEASIVIDLSGFNVPAVRPPPPGLTAAMARITRAPLYGCQDPGAAHGLVGAVVTPIRAVGAETAVLVLQVLSRAEPAALPPVRTLAAAPIFDWRGLHRSGIRARQLPPGSIVEFKPPTVWQQYSTLVITSSALFLLQSGLIVALVLQSRRRRRAERDALRRREELAHMTRVATLGELTASLAHEINQPLAAILANVRAAQRLMAAGPVDGEEIREILADIAADDQRAGEVIRRMRSLLRKSESDVTLLDVNDLVVEVAGLVRSEMILQNVSLDLALSPARHLVHGDRVQLQQVLLNLMMNALDAMKTAAGSNRRVQVRTGADDARVLRVWVEDGGAGVPADKLDQVFEPFVTTKPHGMGLGLAICRSIIQAHGGKIGFANNPERGATFWFTLPTAEETRA